MKCVNCQSENIQSHIVVEDKKSRNSKILLIIIGIYALFALISLFSGANFLATVLITFILAWPVVAITKLILVIIPAREKTIFVCNDCGHEFQKKDLSNQSDNQPSLKTTEDDMESK